MQQTVPPIQEQKQPVLENNLSFDQPLFNPQVTIPVTPLEPQIMPEQMITPMPQMQDTPLFGGDFNTQVTPTIEPIIEQPALPQESLLEVPNINNVVDQNINLYANPVENQPTNTYYEDSQVIQPEVVAPSFEIPVTTEPTADKLTEVKTLLDQNGINYKLYSNETNHCLIIEIEKFS